MYFLWIHRFIILCIPRRARDQYGRFVGPEGLHAAGGSRSGEDNVERKFTQQRSRV